MKKLVSIIIVSFNSTPLLIDCVRRALRSTIPVEVVISDNASTDFTIEALESLAKTERRLRLIKNGKNIGFGAANNIALPEANGTFVLFLNPDCLIEPETVERLLPEFDRHENIGMVGCLIAGRHGQLDPNAARFMPSPRRLFAQAFGLGKKQASHRESNPDSQPVEAISGAFMLIRRSDLVTLGAFDERYFLHWEDLDLCKRFRLAGKEIRYVPSVNVVHWQGRSSRSRPVRVEWHKHESMVHFLHKFHFPSVPFFAFRLLMAPVWLRFVVKAVMSRTAIDPIQYTASDQVLERSKTAWIFGATSMLGQSLITHLAAHGWRVIAFSRHRESETISPSVSWHRANLNDVASTFPNGVPDLLIHAAPIYVLPDCLDRLASCGLKRVIAFSSTSVFSKAQSSDQIERDISFRMLHAEQRISATCHKQGIEWVMLRPTMIYCLGHDKNVTRIAQVIRTVRAFPIFGKATGKRQPVHVDDLSTAVVQLLASENVWGRAYNLSGQETLTYKEMLERIFRKFDVTPVTIEVPPWVWRVALKCLTHMPKFRQLNIAMAYRMETDLIYDHSEATRGFGYSPRSFILD